MPVTPSVALGGLGDLAQQYIDEIDRKIAQDNPNIVKRDYKAGTVSVKVTAIPEDQAIKDAIEAAYKAAGWIRGAAWKSEWRGTRNDGRDEHFFILKK